MGLSCRELQNKNKKQLKPCSSIALDDDVVTRMARGPDPMQFAVAAVKSLHTAEIDSDGQVAGKPFKRCSFEMTLQPRRIMDFPSIAKPRCVALMGASTGP